MATVFFSYSHVDEALRDKLEEHLSMLKHQGLIESWHDRRILAGSNIDDEIDENLEKADVILLLVSSSFIASSYCYGQEMKRAMERHHEGTARVIPVILRTCDWHPAPFGKLLGAPKDGKAVTTWPDQDEAFTDVARQVRQVVTATTTRKEVAQPASATGARQEAFLASPARPASAAAQEPSLTPRSSNLRLKKDFTEFDRDQFLLDSFEYMARFFDTSLQELAARNPGTRGRFQRIDGRSFTAVIYRDGNGLAECTIRVDGHGGRNNYLSYVNSASAPPGTSNEMMHVESDNQTLYFKPLGMRVFGGRQEQKLSQEGASEYFWDMLIEHLQ
ncbi:MULTISPECIES: toll/interleukin-1 receptor domain-containing protein [Noviherbaspirillum]|jgi:hypothetical protein|uniref:toll/interleukin-1 receptor domain-containing protein n=1 Tax=Noviherbaspirillum TaxID=1344552 RepID=UPI00124EC92E|nr:MULTISPECIES: toll/interleukin-1 receptor domain-containing protein [Noviherbaspirillum]